MVADRSDQNTASHQPAVGALAARLRNIYIYVVTALLILIAGALAAVNIVLEEQQEIEDAQYYASLVLQLDSTLNRIAGKCAEILYNGQHGLIGGVLAEVESLVLDYQALLARAEFEQKLKATETAVENQRALLKLREELSMSLVAFRTGDSDTAIERFERGPRLQIVQLQDFIAGIVQLTEEFIDLQRRDLAVLEARLLMGFGLLVLSTLGLLGMALTRVGKATEELEDSLVLTIEQMSKEQRLSTLGQVAGMISHELRNPLGTIRTSVFTLAERLAGQEGFEKILGRIERNVMRCDLIVSGLLDFIRYPQPKLEWVDLTGWLNAQVSQLNPPEGVTVTISDKSVGEVRLDKENLRRAVVNVCTNAFQAMPEPDADKGVACGKLSISVERDEDRIRMMFQDTGEGIDPEHMEHLFEPLFSTKTYGVGLGMPIVQQAMERLGGGVEVTSERGSGTIVALWLDSETLEKES